MSTFVTFLAQLVVFIVAARFLPLLARGGGSGARRWFRLGVASLLAAFLIGASLAGALWLDCSPGALFLGLLAVVLSTVALPDPGLARHGVALGRHRFAVFTLAALSASSLVCVHVPVGTFLTSPGELELHLDYLVRENVVAALTITYGAALLYATLATERLRTALTLLALFVALLTVVYAFVLPFGYPMMAGLAFEQLPLGFETLALRAGLDVGVAALVGAVVAVGVPRLGGARLGFALSTFQVVLLAMLAVNLIPGGRSDERGDAQAAVEEARPLRLSRKEENVLIVFLDRFMGSYVESAVEADPTLASGLSGFTWYPRTVAAGENSIAGVHPIFGGYDYTPVEMNARGLPLAKLSVEAFSLLPHAFSRAGYRASLVDPRGLGFTMAGDCSTIDLPGVRCSHIPASVVRDRASELGFPLKALSKANYVDLLGLLGAMRVAPYTLKQVLSQRGPWRPFLDHSAGTTFSVWAELEAFPRLTQIDDGPPNLVIVSNILPHEPYFVGEDCRPRQTELTLSAEEVARRGHPSLFSFQHQNAAHCALRLTADYFEHLRREGVYDRTTIVVVSDHGIVGPVDDRSSRARAGGTTENVFVRSRSLLLVKPPGATGSLRVSEEFLPNAEVPRLVCERIGGCQNPYLGGRAVEALGRDDPWLVTFVPWQFSQQERDAFVIRSQLLLRNRDPFLRANWSDAPSSSRTPPP